ncbi:MAG: hypothetical protein ACUVUC_01855 [Thermoguttaceae bacterium]
MARVIQKIEIQGKAALALLDTGSIPTWIRSRLRTLPRDWIGSSKHV